MAQIIQYLAYLTTLIPDGLGRWSYALGEIKKLKNKKMELEIALAEAGEEVKTLTTHEQILVHELIVAKASAEDEQNKVEAYAKDLYKKLYKLSQERNSVFKEKRKLVVHREKLEGQRKKLIDEKFDADATITALQTQVNELLSKKHLLFKQGIPHVVYYLLHSGDFISSLGEAYTKVKAHGRHHGLSIEARSL